MSHELSETQRATLRCVCDTVVPAIDHQPDPHGLWGRSATSMGVDVAAEQQLLLLPPEQLAGMQQLLDALGDQGFAAKSQRSREQTLRNTALLGGAPAAAGVGGIIGMVLFLAYGMPDPSGSNPMWEAWGYPGPSPSSQPPVPRAITPTVPDGPELELEADVCIVGSGAGGGVIAGVLAQRGLNVVVLEAGPYLTEADFLGLELPAYQRAYWRGGPQPTADLNVTLLAGSTLGGGTTINWMNCLRTPAWVRDEWAQAGLDDVAGEFDRHIDAVWERIGVNDRCSDLNGTQEAMQRGADLLGWQHNVATRNADPERYDAATGGFIGFGDASGAKRGTMRTYLQDAFEAGAKLVPDCTVQRILVEGGAAAGVVGTWTDAESGRTASVTVRAPRVVAACGSLETPALLLRSGIGGPAAGQNLHIHPTVASMGLYGEDLRAWWGPPHALLVDEFESGADAEGFGFRMEGTQYAPGLIASATPWSSAAEHKRLMERSPQSGVFLARMRDHGGGSVTIDEQGNAVVQYALTDPLDVRTMHRSLAAVARLHEAAGATEIQLLAQNGPVWRRGDDLEAFIERLQRIPLRFGGMTLFTAHQMGTARMGTDPATSVADPHGELHDTPGVWIGDASAFPTATGVNPMISTMALAHRTAETIAQRAGAAAPAQPITA